ncbi:MAG TPA: phosphopantothenoylcysteine decarboxylase [Rhizomicrobium sp.]|nr:phosphopantothenoylcysteine decarboxylase [Rhizomicrobium sp.]
MTARWPAGNSARGAWRSRWRSWRPSNRRCLFQALCRASRRWSRPAPTREPVDPVRFLANHSSGKQGYAIAEALARAGAQTTLISGPVGLAPPQGVKLQRVTTAREMLAACEAALPADVLVMAAAVADWRPDIAANSKIKKSTDRVVPLIKLVENPDILASIAQGSRRPRLLIGFAAETENLVDNAVAKRRSKGADWIVANDVWPGTGAMGGDHTQVHLVTEAGVEDWPPLSKDETATRLLARAAQALTAMRSAAE